MSLFTLAMIAVGIVAGWQANNQINGIPVKDKP